MSEGYKIQFISPPTPSSYVPREISNSNFSVLSNKVKELYLNGALITVSPSPDQYISHIFTVPKKTPGEFRVIFDLSILNQFIRKISFRMDNYHTIIALINRGDFFVSIDLTDAYHAIAMHPDFMRFLTFIFDNVYYQYTCLPQGLTSSPRIFTKVMKVVLTYFRSFAIKIAAWLDDFILSAASAELISSQASFVLKSFEELGFVPNKAKSQLVPVQKITHVGLVWDSVAFTVSVPADKLNDIQLRCAKALSSRVSIRFLSSILGTLEFFRWGFPYAALHFRSLQRQVIQLLGRGLSYNALVYVSDDSKKDLQWWIDCGSELPPKSLSPFTPDITITTDASLSGWGAWSSGGDKVFGRWSSEESENHINVLELKAVLFGFQCLFSQTYNTSILVKSDNTTVVAYINKQGGTCSRVLCDMALDLWVFCIKRNLSICASYIPGVSNGKADELSRRVISDHSYSLSQDVFLALSSSISFPLSVDCFATRLNHKLPKYFSRFKDPFSSLMNAFSVSWTVNVYLFPPIPLISKVLNKILHDDVNNALLICPYWPSQPWFPSLLALLIDYPIFLPAGSVQDPDSMLPKHCQFLAWSIGTSPAQKLDYLRMLPSAPSGVLARKPWLGTKGIGESLPLGVVKGKLVMGKSLLM